MKGWISSSSVQRKNSAVNILTSGFCENNFFSPQPEEFEIAQKLFGLFKVPSTR